MNSSRTSCRIIIERSGKPLIEEVVPDPDAVQSIVKGLEGEPDATVTVERNDFRALLLIAITGSRAFVGLDNNPDGVSQYVATDEERGSGNSFSIGGQETEIDPRYVLSVTAAADVAQQWAAGSDDLRGSWEAQ